MPKSHFQEVREDYERLRRNLSLMQGTLTNAEMGKIIGVSNVTFGARKKNPGSLTVDEIRLLCNRFHVDRAKFLTEELRLS